MLCAPGSSTQSQNAAPATHAPEAIPIAPPFESLRSDWANDIRAGSLDTLIARYAVDATLVDTDGIRHGGRVAIRVYFEKMTSEFDSDITLRSLRTGRSGGLAYDSGEFDDTQHRRRDGHLTIMHGSYLVVLRREDDGRWRIAEQAWVRAALSVSMQPAAR